MGRAERRRAERRNKKKKHQPYVHAGNFDAIGDDEVFTISKKQLDKVIFKTINDNLEQTMHDKIDEVKINAEDEAITTAMRLMFTIPMKVLMENQWRDSYTEKLPGFADLLVDYYHKWQDGDLDIDAMEHEVWEYGGVKLEKTDRT